MAGEKPRKENKGQYRHRLRNDNSIKPEIKPGRFLKPARFDDLKVSKVIKASFLKTEQ